MFFPGFCITTTWFILSEGLKYLKTWQQQIPTSTQQVVKPTLPSVSNFNNNTLNVICSDLSDLRQNELQLANTQLVLENIDCNEEERSVTPNHTDGKAGINSIHLSFYIHMKDIRIIIYFFRH